jgi:hypothetical protein
MLLVYAGDANFVRKSQYHKKTHHNINWWCVQTLKPQTRHFQQHCGASNMRQCPLCKYTCNYYSKTNNQPTSEGEHIIPITITTKIRRRG